MADNGIPRRIRVDMQIPAERAIRDAMLAVEAMPAHELLTDAVVLLGQALGKVADWMDAGNGCEYWHNGASMCGAQAEYRYPAMGGGYAHLCAEHGAKHAEYSERLVGGQWQESPFDKRKREQSHPAALAATTNQSKGRKHG